MLQLCQTTAMYEGGDKLLSDTRNVLNRRPGAPKLMPRWVGPCRVLERVSHVAYCLNLPAKPTSYAVMEAQALVNGGGSTTAIHQGLCLHDSI